MRLPDRTFRAPLRALALPFLVAALAVFAGCGGDKHMAPIVTGPVLPPGTPAANAPDSTTLRWLTAYAVKVEDAAGGVLTADYRYHFSAQSDPFLEALYGDNWTKVDENAALHHMRTGFTNTGGTFVPPVGAMTFSLASAVSDDSTHADSTAWYQRLHGVLALNVRLGAGSDTSTVHLAAALDVYLVRGDAAVLASGQTPSAALWYVRRVDDLTPAGPFPAPRLPGVESQGPTWGGLRAQYRQ